MGVSGPGRPNDLGPTIDARIYGEYFQISHLLLFISMKLGSSINPERDIVRWIIVTIVCHNPNAQARVLRNRSDL